MPIDFLMDEEVARDKMLSDFPEWLNSAPRMDAFYFTNPADEGDTLPGSSGQPDSPARIARLALNEGHLQAQCLTWLLEAKQYTTPPEAASAALLRGGLENLGRAAWVMQGDNFERRRLDALTLWKKSIRLQEKNLEAHRRWSSTVTATPSRVNDNDLNREYERLAQLFPVSGFSSTAAMECLDEVLVAAHYKKEAYWAWTACSGYAHGYEWAHRLYSFASVEGDGSNMYTLTYTGKWASLQNIARIFAEAYVAIFADWQSRALICAK